MTDFTDLTEGYLHPFYSLSFSEIATPLYLPGSGGWVLVRHINGTSYSDAMGPYPLFFCKNWAALIEDIEGNKNQIISLSFVVPPFSKIDTDNYQTYFDKFIPYKDHFILDFSIPLERSISSSRRKDARRALRKLDIDLQVSPNIDHKEWANLYLNLIERHQVTGIRTFSLCCFEKQLAIPNVYYFRALHKGEPVGGNLYIVQGNIVYFHLSAFSDEGYDLDASYAIMWIALQYFSNKMRYMNLGGSVQSEDGSQGLDQFKKGWSSGTQKSYFCGKILDQEKYKTLVEKNGTQNSDWFPAYRQGDF